MADVIVVTRHPALVEVLREQNPDLGDVEVLGSVTAEQVRGKHVYGVLPLYLAAEAKLVTSVAIATPAELRGVELTKDQVKKYMTGQGDYIVTKVK